MPVLPVLPHLSGSPVSPRLLPLALAGLLATAALSACAPTDSGDDASGSGSSGGASGAACTPGDLDTLTAGELTIATDTPAYEPYFVDDDPTNGKGFESAVAYAVADQLGFDKSDVTWVTVPFDNSYAPGPKKFDFDINQISITPEREQAVDFSPGYYTATQAVVALEDSDVDVTSLAELKTLKLGAQTGTTSLTAIRDQIQPDADPLVFKNTNVAKQALLNGQVDAIVADLPTALYISAVEIEGSKVLGQFAYDGSDQEQFGLLLAKDSPLTPCVSQAVTALADDGTLAELEKTWLSETVQVPFLR